VLRCARVRQRQRAERAVADATPPSPARSRGWLGEKGYASALKTQEGPLRVPELKDAGVHDGWERHPAWFGVSLPLHANEVCVLGLGSFVGRWQGDGLVIIVGWLECYCEDRRDWVRPAVGFCNLGDALNRLFEEGVPELDVVDVSFEHAFVDRVPESHC
jgi:hypothetical protein